MTPNPEQPPSSDRGVFGNLPSSRPGVRSPRRDGGKGKSQPKRQSKPATAKARTKPAPRSTPRPVPGPSSPAGRSSTEQPAGHPPPEPASPEPASGHRGVEDVAWAGVTVAAEAATLGVRLFSRALEAVRERR
ncbi:MAG TPA: hypothetical protein VKA47_02820 [Solirubrobacterales bacterium]|nr:hypothetical protein [Solirubrobacterales bacterium]